MGAGGRWRRKESKVMEMEEEGEASPLRFNPAFATVKTIPQ
jgi:hypothetical protein